MFSFVGNLKLFIMVSNELRIGNCILKNGSNYIVDTLFFVDVYDGTAMGFDLQPIPLTEEILLKCKGTLDGYIYSGWDGMHFFRFDEYRANIFEIEIRNDGFYYEDGKIEFLHDLQNCYYFHENRKKELTVNL